MGRNFNGSSDLISFGDIASARFEYNSAWSVVIFYRAEILDSVDAVVAKYDSTDVNTQQARIIVRNTGVARFRHNANGQSVTTGSGMTTDTWYMLAWTNDASGNSDTYVFTMTGLNATSSLSLTGNVSDLTNAITVASYSNGADYFDGDQACLAYFDVKLTQTQLTAYRDAPYQFVAQHIVNCVFFSPLGGWSSPEPDWSGNGNSGTLTGTSVGDNPPVALYMPFDSMPLVTEVGIVGFVGIGKNHPSRNLALRM